MFQCLQSWVRYVAIPGDELVRNPLLPAVFDALGKRELFETAVDLLVEVRAASWSSKAWTGVSCAVGGTPSMGGSREPLVRFSVGGRRACGGVSGQSGTTVNAKQTALLADHQGSSRRHGVRGGKARGGADSWVINGHISRRSGSA